MPRSRPGRLRARSRQEPFTPLDGVPDSTAHVLDRLGRPETSSAAVQQALQTWRYVASLPPATLLAPHNDWAELIGPLARAKLEIALHALPRRHGRPLRVVVERLDEEFAAKTLIDPRADLPQPG